MSYNPKATLPTHKPPRPEITAQPRRDGRRHRDTISIQSLSSFPDLLPHRWKPTPTRSLKLTHKSTCECDRCENQQEGISELDFGE